MDKEHRSLEGEDVSFHTCKWQHCKVPKALGFEERKLAVWRVCWLAKQIIFQSQPSPPTRPKHENFHNKKKSLNCCPCQWKTFSNHLHRFTVKKEIFVLLWSGTTILRWQMHKKHQNWYSETNLVCQTYSSQIISIKPVYFQNLLFKWSETKTEQVMKAL